MLSAPGALDRGQQLLAAQEIARYIIDAQNPTLADTDSVLKRLAASVIDVILEVELDAHLEQHAGSPTVTGTKPNGRNGTRDKLLCTEIGPIRVNAPRDRDGSFDPILIPKRKRRFAHIQQLVLALMVQGLSIREVSAQLAHACGVTISKELIERIELRLTNDLVYWRDHPLDRVYPVLLVDEMRGKTSNHSMLDVVYSIVVAFTADNEQDILGIWAHRPSQDNSQSYWNSAFSTIKKRGVNDVMIVLHRNFPGLPKALNNVWPQALEEDCQARVFADSSQRHSLNSQQQYQDFPPKAA